MKTVNLRAAMALGAFVGAGSLFAETFVWTGAEDAYFTNAANWKVEKSGGGGEWEVASRCPGSVLMADTEAQWAAFVAETDTAVFDETGTKPAKYINLAGHLAVSNTIFRGEMAAPYVFNCVYPNTAHPEWYNYGHYAIRSSGYITFESTLTQAPQFKSGITPAQGDSDSMTFVNESSVAFSLGVLFGRTTHRVTKSNYWPKYYFRGSGSGGFELPAYNNSGNGSFFNHIYFYHEGPTKITGGIGGIAAIEFNAPPSGGVREVEVASGGSISVNAHSWATCNATGDTRIFGAGAVSIYGRDADSPSFGISAGKTLTFDQTTLTVNGSRAYWWIGSGSGALALGADTLNAKVNCEVHVHLGTLAAAKIGLAGVASPLGSGGSVMIDSGKTFAYTGAGEATDRLFVITNFSKAADSTATLSQRGTGEWIVSNVVDRVKSGKADTLVLDNDTAVGATIANPLADGTGGTLAVTKTGTGTWTLSGVQAYTGATTLKGGALAFDTTQTLASPVVVAGDASIVVPDGVTVTLSALSRTSGTLDVATDGTGTLKLTDATFGAAETWLTVNGAEANVQADGSLHAADHTWVSTKDIPARGGVISNTVAATDVVGITTDGEPTAGPITVEDAAGVSVAGVVQKTAADATVSLASGQTLSAQVLGIEPGKGDLAFAGAGTVQAGGSRLTLDVADEGQKLTVATGLAANGAPVVKIGAGTAELDKTGGWRARVQLADGALNLGTNAADRLVIASDGADDAPILDIWARAGGTTLTNRPNGEAKIAITGTSVTPLTLYLDSGADVRIAGAGTAVTLSNTFISAFTTANTTSTLEVVDHADASFGSRIVIGGFGGKGISYKKNHAVLVVSNAFLRGSRFTGSDWQDCSNGFIIGNVYGPGEMFVEDGAVVTGRLVMCYYDYYGDQLNCKSAYYQRGGHTAFGNDNSIGWFGSSYVEMSGGTMDWLGETSIGTRSGYGTHTTGNAAFALLGGQVTMAKGGTFNLGTSVSWDLYRQTADTLQNAALYLGGGSLSLSTSCVFCEGVGLTVLTLDHPDSWISPYTFTMKPAADARGLLLNLNAGQIKTTGFKRSDGCTGPTYLNLNGGTIYSDGGNKTRIATGAFTRRTVYENGFTWWHYNTWDGTIDGPFVAATGQGLSAIELPESVKEQRLVGAPLVEIEGDGTGASAFALFDSYTHHITNIVVTSHGWDYTWAKAHLVYGCFETNTANLVCTLADNRGGPFIYRGIGENGIRDSNQGLAGTNEFTKVVVWGGTLRPLNEGAIPWDAEVVLSNNCTLAMDTNTVRFASLAGLTGQITSANADSQNVLTVQVDHPAEESLAAAVNSGSNPTLSLVADGVWSLSGATVAAWNENGSWPTCGKDFTFAPGASIAISDAASLDPARRYTLFAVTESGKTLSGTPTVTVAGGSDWRVANVGNQMILRQRRGVAIFVR